MSKPVVSSQWGGMEKARRLFDSRENPIEDRIELAITIKRPAYQRRAVKKFDKETGEKVDTGVVAEGISGGAFITLREPFWTARKGKPTAIRKATLLTWTSKMSAASFSIPAGPSANLGTCPASVEAHVQRVGAYEAFHESLDRAPGTKSDVTGTYICDKCYAGKNNYLMHKSTSLAQMVRFGWLKMALRVDMDGMQLNPGPNYDTFKLNPADAQSIRRSGFVAEMSKAIRALREPATAEQLAKMEVDPRFFRIHDAGDFFHPWYYVAWTEICRLNPEVRFWAPTRVWVYPNWQRTFIDFPPPANLALRPSALFFGARPPEVPGLSPGTTSFAHGKPVPAGVVQCPVYQSEGANSCASVKCRRCWMQREAVSYAAH